MFYYRALGVHQDLPESAKWYRMAAEQGNAEAQLGLGGHYYAGEGVPKDEVEALAWFSVSAAAGNAMAARQRDVLERDLTPEQKLHAQDRAKKLVENIEAKKRAALPKPAKD